MFIRQELKPRKVFQVDEGRVLVVEIQTKQKKILLGKIYAPNGAKENFFVKLKQKLDKKEYDQIILLGNINGVRDPEIDKTPRKKGGKW